MTHRRITPLALAALVAASPVAAGTLDVTVRTRDGAPVAGQQISLVPLSSYRAAARTGAIVSPYFDVETTDDDGRLTFTDVGSGTYTVFVFGHPVDPTLLKAEANPRAPAPIVTLEGRDDRRHIELELWRGVPLKLELVGFEDMPLDGFYVVFRDVETDVEVKRVAFSEPSFEYLLAPTVWDVSLEFRRGFELAGVELDGEPVAAEAVRLDLARQPWPRTLRFNVTTSDWIPEGVVSVHDFNTPDAPLTVEASVPGARHGPSALEIYARDDLSEPVRTTTANGFRATGIDGLPPGDYLIVAGGRNTLESRVELPGFDPEAEPRTVEIELSWGAAIQIQALDLRDRPIADLEVEIERLSEEQRLLLRDDGFREAKLRRTGSTGNSGYYEAVGFYPGRYIVRTRLRRVTADDFRILFGVDGELRPGPELEVELEDGPVEIEVRVAPLER